MCSGNTAEYALRVGIRQANMRGINGSDRGQTARLQSNTQSETGVAAHGQPSA